MKLAGLNDITSYCVARILNRCWHSTLGTNLLNYLEKTTGYPVCTVVTFHLLCFAMLLVFFTVSISVKTYRHNFLRHLRKV